MDNKAVTHPTLSRGINLGILGALGAALAASVCCLGPLVLVSLGATGAWIGNLSALEPYRPIFMLLASGALAVAFYRVYRPQPEACEPGSMCAKSGAKTMNKVSLWLATLLVAGLFVSPYFVGQLAAGAQEAKPVSTETVSLKVANMTCAACPVTVRKSLTRLDGVVDARVTLDPPKAVVEFDPTKVTTKELTEATTAVGYPSEILAEKE